MVNDSNCTYHGKNHRYDHLRASALLHNIRNIKICIGTGHPSSKHDHRHCYVTFSSQNAGTVMGSTHLYEISKLNCSKVNFP